MLCCSASESGERNDLQRDGKLISYLDFATVCSRKNIGAFALQFYRKGRYDSRCRGQAPRMETHEFGTVFCLFSISRAGFSSVARKPLRSVRVNGVGNHEIGSGFDSRRRSHPRFKSRCKRAMRSVQGSIPGNRSHEIGSGFNSRQ